MILKIVGFIMIAFCGGMIGNYHSYRLKKLKESCYESVQIIQKISTLIRYRELNVYEIAAELQREGGYRNTEFIQSLPCEYRSGENFRLMWDKAIDEDSNLGETESSLLKGFGEELGTSDTEGQLMLLEAIRARLSEIQQQRSEEYHTKGRLYRSVGILSGVMAAILII